MKYLLTFCLIVVIVGCVNLDEASLCKDYCDVWSEAYANESNIFECSISEIAQEKFIRECETSCSNAYMSAADQYHNNIDTCLNCLISNLDGDQRVLDFDEIVRGDNEKCAAECSFTTQFFSSFYVIKPECKKEEN